MASLTLKNLPESLRQELKADAAAQGRSLNTHIIHLLQLSAAEQARRRRMRERRQDLEAFVASLPRTAGSAAMLREDRER